MNTHNEQVRIGSGFDGGSGALWASAFVITALILIQASRHDAGQQAHAGLIAEAGAYRILTSGTGNNEDIIAVLNQTDETVSIYSVENGRSLELYQSASLIELFSENAASGGGRR